MLARLLSIPRRAPLAFSVAYGGAKTIAADVLVQKYLEGRDTIDQTRSLVFLGFGCFQVGFVQYMIYSKLFPFIFKGAGTFSQQTISQMLKDRQGLKNVLKQVSLDMFVYHPCCYFPVFYTCQEIVNGNVHKPSKTVRDAIRKYVPNAWEDWKGLWQIFIPVSLFQNSFCPVHLRVPCVATAGFFYCIILSMTRGDEVNSAAVAAKNMKKMSDEEFERCVAAIRRRYWGSKVGVSFDEFTSIMDELGLGEASAALFQTLDDSEGIYPRGSGVVDAVRLAGGLKLIAGRCLPEERAEFIAANPRFVLEQVPARVLKNMKNMSDDQFETCLQHIQRSKSVRQRPLNRKIGFGREEFDIIMKDLGLSEVSGALFDAFDDAEGRYPRGSGVVDAVRLVEGLQLLSGRCSPDERAKFIAANPNFILDESPARLVTSMADMSDDEFETCLESIRSRRWASKEGIGRTEFNIIMRELGLEKASSVLFETFDDSDGLYPRGSGMVDPVRLMDGLKLLAGRCPPGERTKFISANPRLLLEEVPARAFARIKSLSDDEFEACLLRIHQSGRKQLLKDRVGIGREEFDIIMQELGLGESSGILFQALDDSDGRYPRGSGVVDAVRLADGLKLLAGRCLPDERGKFIAANPKFLTAEVPGRLRSGVANLSVDEFDGCVASIRSRQWASKDGIGREEFDIIMQELGLSDASSALFEALDHSDGLYPRGSGIIDAFRFVEGLKLLSGRCLPEERLKFISANPQFLLEEVPPRAYK